MDLRQLKYFISVVEQGSLTHAAAALHLSQPTLGEHMRHLEEELGVVLFVRHSRGISPTPAALVLKERALHLLGYARDTARIVRDAGGVVRGAVTLGMSPGLNEMFSADLIECTRSAYPGVTINVVEDLSSVLTERMANRGETLDLALVSGFELDSAATVDAVRVAEERLYLVGAPGRLGASDRTIPFKALEQFPLLLLGSGGQAKPNGLRRYLIQVAEMLGIALNVETELRSVAALRQLVERDLGVAVLPSLAVRQAVDAGKLVARPITDPAITREVCLLAPAGTEPGRAADAVRTLLLGLIETRLEVSDSPLRRIGSGSGSGSG